jgi:hypothetical protein
MRLLDLISWWRWSASCQGENHPDIVPEAFWRIVAGFSVWASHADRRMNAAEQRSRVQFSADYV